MASAARDLLAVPSTKVDVKRLFSGGRDVLGIRRIALSANFMRMVKLIKSYFD